MKFRHLIFLMFVTQTIFAQESKDETVNKTKPSWSVALPERQSKPEIINSAEPDEEGNKDRPDFGFDESGMSVQSFHSGLKIDSIEPPGLNQEQEKTIQDTEEVKTDNQVRKEKSVLKEQANTVDIEAVEKTEPSEEYTWKLVFSETVVIPKTLYFSKKKVRLKVTINPLGEVVKVRGVRNSTPHSVLNYVNQAMKSWRFVPPVDFGISEEISKELAIALDLR